MPDTGLTVRTANGTADDINVPCEEGWSVFDLKAYLSQHHPLKPPVREQKLIHGGRLLLDEMPLKAIITHGVPLVLHLVISPVFLRTQSVPSTIPTWTAEDRPRMTPAQPRLLTTTQSQNQLGLTNPWQGGQHNGRPFPVHAGVGWPNPYLMTMPPYYAAQLAQWYQTAQGQGGPVGVTTAGPPHHGAGGDEGNVDGLVADDPWLLENGQQQDLELQQEEMAVMNAGGGLGMMAGQFPARHRDLVDYVYMLMMILFLGTIGYFTGSLHQFIIFFAGVMVILMNQGGWFTVQRRQARPAREEDTEPRQQEPEETTNNGRGQEEEEAIPEGNTEETEEVDGNDQVPQENESQEQQPQPQPQDQPPNLGFVRTMAIFVTSFFTSLFPQHMPELEGI